MKRRFPTATPAVYGVPRCLLSLGSAICPLCRKPFALERCIKLHVDLPPITQDDKVAGFLRRLASAVTEDAPLDTALDNMQDILKWLNSQPPKSVRSL